jgi:hypothetical protein
VTAVLRVVSFGGQGAAGTDFEFLRFELRRPGRCMLSGYPGVTLLDGQRRYNVHVGRYPANHLRTVQLEADHPAYFGLVFQGASPTTGRPCHGKITGLRVIPPNDRQALSVKLTPRPLVYVCLQSVQVEAVRSTSAPN